MADTTRLDDRMTELIALWNKRGLSLTESEEFIRLAIPRVESKDIPTEELFQLLLRRTWDAGMSARVVRVLTTAEMRGELMRRMESRLDELASQQEYPATPDESFAIEEGSTLSSGAEAREQVAATWKLLDEPLRSRIVEEAAKKMTVTCIDEFAHTGDTEPAAPGPLDHLEILAERRESILYKLLTNSRRSEDLLREMLESLGRIEESLIVAKLPSWKECDHAWVETTGGKRCTVCGVTIMPRLT